MLNRLLQEKIAALENKNAELEAKVNWFEEHFRLNQHRLYGRSSEQTAPTEQMTLFNEAEALNDVKPRSPEPMVEEISKSSLLLCLKELFPVALHQRIRLLIPWFKNICTVFP